jgi:hypothetical protein
LGIGFPPVAAQLDWPMSLDKSLAANGSGSTKPVTTLNYNITWHILILMGELFIRAQSLR